jgi:LysR family transcriptional activator of nhaA
VQPLATHRINRIDQPVGTHYAAGPVLNFNHLYYFHVIASEGSIKAAADRLGVTQPTVSEQLRMLERTLDVELFERTPSGLKLTRAGREAFEHTNAMFLAGERLVRTLGRVGDPPATVLRVGMSASMARTIAADFLMPVLTVEGCRPLIRTGDFAELLRDVRARELDLLLGETEPAEVGRAGLTVELIHRPTLVAVVLSSIDPKADWNNLSLLQYRPTSIFHWEVANYLKDHNLSPAEMGELDDTFLMLEAVLRGGFVAFVPRSVARAAIRSGQVSVLAQIAPTTAGIFAVYPDNDGLQLTRKAVELLIANARSGLEG